MITSDYNYRRFFLTATTAMIVFPFATPSYAAQTQPWRLSDVINEKIPEHSFCLSDRVFNNGVTVNVAKNITGKMTLAFDYKRSVFDTDKQLKVNLGNGDNALSYVVSPASEKALVLRNVDDAAVWDMLSSSKMLLVTIGGVDYSFDISAFSGDKNNSFNTCLASLESDLPVIATPSVPINERDFAPKETVFTANTSNALANNSASAPIVAVPVADVVQNTLEKTFPSPTVRNNTLVSLNTEAHQAYGVKENIVFSPSEDHLPAPVVSIESSTIETVQENVVFQENAAALIAADINEANISTVTEEIIFSEKTKVMNDSIMNASNVSGMQNAMAFPQIVERFSQDTVDDDNIAFVTETLIFSNKVPVIQNDLINNDNIIIAEEVLVFPDNNLAILSENIDETNVADYEETIAFEKQTHPIDDIETDENQIALVTETLVFPEKKPVFTGESIDTTNIAMVDEKISFPDERPSLFAENIDDSNVTAYEETIAFEKQIQPIDDINTDDSLIALVNETLDFEEEKPVFTDEPIDMGNIAPVEEQMSFPQSQPVPMIEDIHDENIAVVEENIDFPDTVMNTEIASETSDPILNDDTIGNMPAIADASPPIIAEQSESEMLLVADAEQSASDTRRIISVPVVYDAEDTIKHDTTQINTQNQINGDSAITNDILIAEADTVPLDPVAAQDTMTTIDALPEIPNAPDVPDTAVASEDIIVSRENPVANVIYDDFNALAGNNNARTEELALLQDLDRPQQDISTPAKTVADAPETAVTQKTESFIQTPQNNTDADIATLLRDAEIDRNIKITEPNVSSDKNDARFYQWTALGTFGSAVQQPYRDELSFEESTIAYLDKTKRRCNGDFSIVPHQSFGEDTNRVDSYDIACIGSDAESTASIVFFVKNDTVHMVAHETLPDDMESVMDIRDRLLTVLKT